MVCFGKCFTYIKKKKILAVLGLHCCVHAFSSCGEQGLLSSYSAWASHCSGFSCPRAQALGCMGFSSCGIRGLVAPQHVGSSQTRDSAGVPCTARQILNHWTTREAPHMLLQNFYSVIMECRNLDLFK